MTKFTRLIAPALLASLALGAAPASAAGWDKHDTGQRRAPVATQFAYGKAALLRSQIARLDRNIDEARRHRAISGREAARLNTQVDGLQRLYARYARGGFTVAEARVLDTRIDLVQRQFRRELHDRDGRRG